MAQHHKVGKLRSLKLTPYVSFPLARGEDTVKADGDLLKPIVVIQLC